MELDPKMIFRAHQFRSTESAINRSSGPSVDPFCFDKDGSISFFRSMATIIWLASPSFSICLFRRHNRFIFRCLVHGIQLRSLISKPLDDAPLVVIFKLAFAPANVNHRRWVENCRAMSCTECKKVTEAAIDTCNRKVLLSLFNRDGDRFSKSVLRPYRAARLFLASVKSFHRYKGVLDRNLRCQPFKSARTGSTEKAIW